MTQPAGSPADLDAVRRILFGADVARLEETLATDRQAVAARAAELEQRLERGLADLERRLGEQLAELNQRTTAQLEDLGRRQLAHAGKVTELLDKVMAELSRRSDESAAETRAAIEEIRTRVADVDRRKLNLVDFGASLATLGQRFSSAGSEEDPAG